MHSKVTSLGLITFVETSVRVTTLLIIFSMCGESKCPTCTIWSMRHAEELRWEVERIWHEAHEQRRASGQFEFDSFVIDRLASHDVECFLGVIGKRQGSSNSHLGYIHWWLTFDKTVRDFEQKLYESLGNEAPKAPVMSPDFLADYLAVGPLRGRVTKQVESGLPLAMFDILADQIPVELLELAGGVRKDCGELDERLLRRRLRDTMDNIKRARGVSCDWRFCRNSSEFGACAEGPATLM